MSPWVPAFSIAILVATVPLAWVLRLLLDQPSPLVLSHRRWPPPAHLVLIGTVTLGVAWFIAAVYSSAAVAPWAALFRFLIAAFVYLFGFVLLVRQFAGLYPEYLVTTGRCGVSIRKVSYRNVADLETVAESGGETRFRITLRSGEVLSFHLPTREAPELAKRIRQSQPPL